MLFLSGAGLRPGLRSCGTLHLQLHPAIERAALWDAGRHRNRNLGHRGLRATEQKEKV